MNPARIMIKSPRRNMKLALICLFFAASAATWAEPRIFGVPHQTSRAAFTLNGLQLLVRQTTPNVGSFIHALDATTGQRQYLLTEHLGGYWESSNGSLFYFDAPIGPVHRRSLDDGGLLQTYTVGEGEPITAFAASPDGSRFATGHGGVLHIWDTANGSLIHELAHGLINVESARFSPDGRLVLSEVRQRCVLWDANSGEKLRDMDDFRIVASSAVFSPDNAYIYAAALLGDGLATVGAVRQWDVSTGAVVNTFPAHGSTVRDLAISPDGARLLTVSERGTARLWNPNNGSLIYNIAEAGQTLAAAFSEDGQSIVTVSKSTTIQWWDTATGGETDEYPASPGHEGFVTAVAYSQDGTMVLTGSDDTTAILWDAETTEELRKLTGHTDTVTAAAITADGSTAVTASLDATVRLWDIQSGDELRVLTDHTDGINKMELSPDGRHVLTASNDGTAKIFDVDSGALLQSLFGELGVVLDASYSPDGRLVITGYKRRSKIWDLSTGTAIRTSPRAPVDEIPCHFATFTPDGTRIFTTHEYMPLADALNGETQDEYTWDIREPYSRMVDAHFTRGGRSLLTQRWVWALAVDPVRIYYGYFRGLARDEFEFPTVRNATAVALSPDDHFGIFGLADGTAIALELPQESERVTDGTIFMEPNPSMIELGEKVTLSFTSILMSNSRSNYFFDFQWFHEGAPIPGATSKSLSLENFTFSDEGAYTVSCIGYLWGGAFPIRENYALFTSPDFFLSAESSANVPTLSPWGFLALFIMLAIAGVAMFRKASSRACER